jgi:hypothetical protein
MPPPRDRGSDVHSVGFFGKLYRNKYVVLILSSIFECSFNCINSVLPNSFFYEKKINNEQTIIITFRFIRSVMFILLATTIMGMRNAFTVGGY